MPYTWLLTLSLLYAVLFTFAHCQSDLEGDYSNEYDDVRPHFVYPDEPRLDRRLSEAAQQFGQSVRNAWQSMVDSFKNYFQELHDVFANGEQNNAETLSGNN
ncbi:uncharacterized protein LOC108607285 [Drosophila busckii]|uniref:uncharacterized protein LOC108607285 n=1 Tax=Drosophila busckii TaxID=30019 RepID=UPI00083F1FE9|nr:uncharacterized protein LOC108607285 [Drosophila busckii]